MLQIQQVHVQYHSTIEELSYVNRRYSEYMIGVLLGHKYLW